MAYQNIGPSNLLLFAEEMKIPSYYLPKGIKSLFRNTDEAEMWRHLVSTIQPAYKIQEIRKNLLRSKIKHLQIVNDSPEEHTHWKNTNSNFIKLKNIKSQLLEAQNVLKTKLSQAKIHEVCCDTIKRTMQYKTLKKNIYIKKIDKISVEIMTVKDHKKIFDTLLSKKTFDVDDLNKKMQNLLLKTKHFTPQQEEKREELDDKIKEVEFQIPKNIIWEWFLNNEKLSLSKIMNLVENVNLNHDDYLIRNAGNTMLASMTELSARHIKLYINIMKKAHLIHQYQNEYLDFLNNLENQGKDHEIEFLDLAFKSFFLSTKAQIVTELINKINKLSSVLVDYESKNIELLNKIKYIDIDMRKNIQNVEQFDLALQNTPKKVLNIRNKIFERMQSFYQYVKNNPEVAASCNQDIQELEAFKEIDISQITLLMYNGTKKRQGHFLTNAYYKTEENSRISYYFINLFGWQSPISIVLRIVEEMTSSFFYKQKNCVINYKNFQRSEILKDNLFNFYAIMENLDKLQADIKWKIKGARCLIEFWLKNVLKNYISTDRLFNGKPYKYYEDLLLQYKKML